jgi:Putative Actinobacterial Holin-X, holin superfamily III
MHQPWCSIQAPACACSLLPVALRRVYDRYASNWTAISGSGVTHAYGQTAAGSFDAMSVPGLDQVGERPLEELAQTASQQAVVLAREQVDAVRRELAARARQAGPGVAMLGGGALLAALASGTGTAALIRLLARRPGAAAALGVTGAYAGAGALLARHGLVRLREAGPREPDVSVEDKPAKPDRGSAKRGTKPAARSSRRTKSAAKSAPQSARRAKPQSKSPSSRTRAAGTQTTRTRRRAS